MRAINFKNSIKLKNIRNLILNKSTLYSEKRNFVEFLKIKRKDFKRIDSDDINFFKSFLNPNSIETENLDIYNTDWIRKYKGDSKLVLKPTNIQEVSQILNYCNKNKLAVVPQSGNTGLVGGSVPVFDEIIINMTKMNKIVSFNKDDDSIYCEAGCVLETLNSYVENNFSKVMPIDLGAKGSCQIGGNLSTNAGGIHFIKYGSLRNTCKSLTVVLPSGQVVYCDNYQSYDLKQLFIGSEGTLGIIVETEIFTEKLLKDKTLSIIGLNNFKSVIDIYMQAKNYFKENLTAIEFFDHGCMIMNIEYLNSNPIFSENFPFYLLLECSYPEKSNSHLEKSFDKMANFLEKNKLDELCVISDDESKMNELWAYREKISSACSKRGVVFKYDVSLPLTEFYKLVEDVRYRVAHDLNQSVITVGYGHVGDYNLHLNVCYNKFEHDEGFCKLENILEPYIFDYLKSIHGSISAEHGVGLAKALYLNRSQSENNINLMKKIKQAIDPNGIMNPYKILY
jgi:(R)-2-hydroxyglutarate---pyruvate transhydrogenase